MSQQCKNIVGRPLDDPTTCSYCRGHGPIVSSLCSNYQGLSNTSHLLFCQLGFLKDRLSYRWSVLVLCVSLELALPYLERTLSSTNTEPSSEFMHIGGHRGVSAGMKILLAYPKNSRDAFYISTWELSPVDLCSMTKSGWIVARGNIKVFAGQRKRR